MKVCEICGKEIELSETYTIGGVTKCRDCATNDIYNKNMNHDNEIGVIQQNMLETKEKSYFWIRFMRVFIIFEFIGLLIGSVNLADYVGQYYRSGTAFFLSFCGFVFASFAAIGFQLIFIKLAEDISVIRKSLSNKKKDE